MTRLCTYGLSRCAEPATVLLAQIDSDDERHKQGLDWRAHLRENGHPLCQQHAADRLSHYSTATQERLYGAISGPLSLLADTKE